MKKQISPLLILLLITSISTYSQGFLNKLKNETKKIDTKVLIQVGAEVVNQITKKSDKKSNSSTKNNDSCGEIFGFENNTAIDKVQYFQSSLLEQIKRIDDINYEIKNNNNFNGEIRVNEELNLKVKNNYIRYIPFLSMTVIDLEQKNNQNKLCEIFNIYKENEIEVQLLETNFSKLYQNLEVTNHKEAVLNLQKQNEEKEKNKQKEIAEINQKKLEKEKHNRERYEWSKNTKPFNLPYQRKYTTFNFQCNECHLKHEATQLRVVKYPNYKETDNPAFAEEAFNIGFYTDALIVKGLFNANSFKINGCKKSESGNHKWIELNPTEQNENKNFTNQDAISSTKI